MPKMEHKKMQEIVHISKIETVMDAGEIDRDLDQDHIQEIDTVQDPQDTGVEIDQGHQHIGHLEEEIVPDQEADIVIGHDQE